MPRISDADVKAILDTDLETTPFIAAATLMIDAYLISAGLPAVLLTEIERWLAAHLACIRDPRFREARTGGDAMVFERGQAGQGLSATSYGQQVLLLDTSGILALVTTTKRASIRVD